MKYKCECCGIIIDEEDVKVAHEYIGEAWGVPQYEDGLICPRCGSYVSEYEEEEETMTLKELIESLITLRDEGECVSQTAVLDEAINRLSEMEDK